jgi:purine-binding chemotaxis protein CheW
MSAPDDRDRTARALEGLAGKYLTFVLGEEEYGLPVLRVREIIKMLDITVVPQVPHHVRGVVNLRGKVIPVVDLRAKFGFAEVDYTDRTSIVVVEVAGRSGKAMLGVIVDAVSEVLSVAAEDLEATPEFGAHIDTGYMMAVAKVKGQVKILLDLDRVFVADGLGAAAVAA